MRIKLVKFIIVLFGSLLVVLLLIYGKAYTNTEARINKVYQVTPQVIAVPDDSAALQLGSRLVVAKGCKRCHGEDLGGKVFIDNVFGRFIAGNLTRGKGGLPDTYQVQDWVLALKHGIRKDGKPLFLMPSNEFAQLTEHDMGAIIAYCNRLPKVDRPLPESRIGPVGRLVADWYEEVPLLLAERIDHQRKLVKALQPEVTVAYGKYIAASCEDCHRESMKGGEPIAPGFPPVGDISSTGNPGEWTTEQFITTLRTGKTPEGKVLNPKIMPWFMATAYTDTELQALHLYLQSQ